VHRPDIVDLLICMTVSSAIENRHFLPFPSIDDGKGKPSFDSKKPEEIRDLLNKCPGVVTLQEWVKTGTLLEKCKELSPLLYPLLRWIVATNRAHVKGVESKLPMNTDYQFILKSSSPEKEEKFQKAKIEHGSFFAWHGSPLGNWHSILRVGLKNYSDTVHQRNGRVYGPGIYMAADSGTSIGYAAGYSTWENSQFGKSLKCVALCEVIDFGSESECLGQVHRPKCKHCTSAPYFRIEMEEYVITRFLFIFSGNASFNKNASELKNNIEQMKEFQPQKKDKEKK